MQAYWHSSSSVCLGYIGSYPCCSRKSFVALLPCSNFQSPCFCNMAVWQQQPLGKLTVQLNYQFVCSGLCKAFLINGFGNPIGTITFPHSFTDWGECTPFPIAYQFACHSVRPDWSNLKSSWLTNFRSKEAQNYGDFKKKIISELNLLF